MNDWTAEAGYLSEEEVRQIWVDEIEPSVFAGAQRVDHPVTILLGGQPGAGKTRAGQAAAAAIQGPVVAIIGDDLRLFHPRYRQVMDEDHLSMPDLTAQAAGRWIQMCVDHAHEQGYSILIEGTWRNPQVPLQGAAAARAAGREVQACVVAVQPELSRLSTLGRYYQDRLGGRDARWTPQSAHEQTVAALPETVRTVAASPAVDSIRVTTRDGSTLLHDTGPASPERAAAAVAALAQGMTRPFSPAELTRYEAQIGAATAAHERFTPDHPDARQAWTRVLDTDLPLMRARTAAGLAATGRVGQQDRSGTVAAEPSRTRFPTAGGARSPEIER